MAALFVLDTVTGDDTVFVPGYVLGPLIVALAAGPRPTAAVGLVATALGFVGLLQDGDFEGQDVIRIVTVAAGSALAVWIAVLRTRLQRANTELGEAVGLLDIVFAHAPVGIALLDRDLRLLRVNDRLAEIAGARPATRSRRFCPTCRPRCGRTRHGSCARGRRSARSRSAGPSATGSRRTGLCAATARRSASASSWRTSPSGARPARPARADRPLRGAAARALRRRRGPRRARAGRPLRVRQCGVRAAQRLHVPRARGDGLDARSRGRVRAGRGSHARAGPDRGGRRRSPGSRSRCGAATASWVDLEIGGTLARRRGPAPARRGRARHHGPPAGRGGARAAAGPGRAAGRGERAVRPLARRGAHAPARRAAVRTRHRRDLRDRARRRTRSAARRRRRSPTRTSARTS